MIFFFNDYPANSCEFKLDSSASLFREYLSNEILTEILRKFGTMLQKIFREFTFNPESLFPDFSSVSSWTVTWREAWARGELQTVR